MGGELTPSLGAANKFCRTKFPNDRFLEKK